MIVLMMRTYVWIAANWLIAVLAMTADAAEQRLADYRRVVIGDEAGPVAKAAASANANVAKHSMCRAFSLTTARRCN